MTAGLALQDACRKLSVPGMAELKMRVGLAQGQVWIAHLHAARSEPETVMCGDVFGRVGAIGKGREGVFLDQSLWDQISAAVALGAAVSVTADRAGLWVTSLGRTLAQPGPAPVRTIADAAIIARYVPDYLRDLLDGVATDWLAEFRSTQILFARFSDFRFQDPADLPALSALARGLRTAIDGSGHGAGRRSAGRVCRKYRRHRWQSLCRGGGV